MIGNKIRNLIIVIAFFLCVSVPAYAAETLIFSDTFTGDNGTDLVSHSPDTGTSWQEVVDSNGLSWIELRDDNCRANSSGTVSSNSIAYVANPAPSTPDMKVVFTLNAFPTSADDILLVYARYQDNNNFYSIGIAPDSGDTKSVWLQKTVSGVTGDALDGGSATIAIGSTITFEVVGTNLTMKVNDVTQLSATDSAISSAGKAGLHFGAYDAWTDADISSLYRVDDFEVYEITSDTERRMW